MELYKHSFSQKHPAEGEDLNNLWSGLKRSQVVYMSRSGKLAGANDIFISWTICCSLFLFLIRGQPRHLLYVSNSSRHRKYTLCWVFLQSIGLKLKIPMAATVLNMVKEVAWESQTGHVCPQRYSHLCRRKRAVRRTHIPGDHQSRMRVSPASPVASCLSGSWGVTGRSGLVYLCFEQ